MIEEMLSNHINVNSLANKSKVVKSPRYSEPLMQESEFQFLQRKKENESLGRNKKETSQGMDQVREEDNRSNSKNLGEHRQKELK